MADETRRQADRQHRAEPEGRIEVARPVSTQVQNAARQLDVEDVESTQRDGLRAEQENECACVRVAPNEPNRATEGGRLRRRALATAHRSRHGVSCREHEERSRCANRRTDREQHSRRAHRQDDADEQRAAERTQTLDPARHHVRGREFLRQPRQPGRERRLGRASDRKGDRRQDEKRVHDQPRGTREHRHRNDRTRHRLAEVSGDEHSPRCVSLPERRQRRGADRSRYEHRRRKHARSRDPSMRVRVDEHRKPRAPLRDIERREGELDPPEVPVPRQDPEHTGDRPGLPLIGHSGDHLTQQPEAPPRGAATFRRRLPRPHQLLCAGLKQLRLRSLWRWHARAACGRPATGGCCTSRRAA